MRDKGRRLMYLRALMPPMTAPENEKEVSWYLPVASVCRKDLRLTFVSLVGKSSVAMATNR